MCRFPLPFVICSSVSPLQVQRSTQERVYVLTSSALYFGGLPASQQPSEPLPPAFVGCLGDATVRGTLQNFAAATEHSNAVLASCPASYDEDLSTEETPHISTGKEGVRTSRACKIAENPLPVSALTY